MSKRSSLASYKLRSLVELLYRYKSHSHNISKGDQYCDVPIPKLGYGYSMHRGLQMISYSSGTCREPDTNMVKDDKDKVRPPVPALPRPSRFPIWVRWVLGSMLSLLVPFWKLKWEKLLRLEGEVEMVVEVFENVVEVVEKVADVTEKVSTDVANKLPDNSKLKKAALLVQHVSNATAKDAQITEDLIHKVDELKQDLKDLEKLVEPVFDHMVEKEVDGK